MSNPDLAEDADEIKHSLHKGRGRWLAVYASVLDHPIVGLPKNKPWSAMEAWSWMMFQAGYRDYGYDVRGRIVRLQRGQLVLSARHLAREATWTRKAAVSFLAKLTRHGMIETETTRPVEGQLSLNLSGSKRGPLRGPPLTVVTICNYNKYQHPYTPKGATQGATKGPLGGHYLTSTTDKIEQESSNQSPRSSIPREDQSSDFGTDGTDGQGSNVVPFRAPMVMDAPGSQFTIPTKTREKIEALGVDPDELLDRMYEQIDRGKRIGSKSRYLITSAINEVHERDGTPVDVLKAIISGNKFARQAALVAATAGKPEPTEAEKQLRARATAPRSAGSALLKTLKK